MLSRSVLLLRIVLRPLSALLPGCADINVPVKEREYCSVNFYSNGTTTLNAQKKNFTNADGFGLRFMRLPSDEDLSSSAISIVHLQELIKQHVAFADTMQKPMAAKKITSD